MGLTCDECGKTLVGRQERWCSDDCRKRNWVRNHPAYYRQWTREHRIKKQKEKEE